MAEQGQKLVKRPYVAPRLVRVGSFEQVTQDLLMREALGIINGVDWSLGRVS